MQVGHRADLSRFRHPRRKAGPQSHGTPPESAGLPKECPPRRSLARLVRGDHDGTAVGAARPNKEGHLMSVPTRSRRTRRTRARARRRPCVLRRSRRRTGVHDRPRHRSGLRRPRRLHRHEHRTVGAQRRSRSLPRHRAGRLRAPRRGQRRDAQRRCRRRPGTGRPHDCLQRRRRPAGLARQRSHGHRPRQPDADSPAPTASPRRRSSPVRSHSTPQGDPNAQFVFEIGSALTTASASSVVLVNGATPCNVYWQVGSSATLGTTTAFQGNLMALSSISLNNGADRDRPRCSPATARSA